MMLCVILSQSSCTTSAVDSFCSIYDPVIVNKGDGTISASSGVKRRLLGNEQAYRGLCIK